uniref:Uncharacterized protein n=1 Tax=Rhizophora mucronata TaxID=61149 RepID=A0A2P2IXK4_RHIMU
MPRDQLKECKRAKKQTSKS